MIGKSARKYLAFAGLAAAVATGSAGIASAQMRSSPDRIIAGDVADPAAWPFIAAMYLDPPGEPGDREFQICGGMVISSRYVLTAAHCVENARPKRLSFVVGRPDLRDESVGRRIEVRSVQVDPDYSPPFFRGDFAVVGLKADALVKPAVLPNRTEDREATAVGDPVRVAGWGATRPSGGRASKVLLTTDESVVPEKSCKRFYGGAFKSKEQICTLGTERGTGPCFGDSGGPLVADTTAGPLLLGAVSGGGQRCATQPDYYARVSASLDFIEDASGVVPATP